MDRFAREALVEKKGGTRGPAFSSHSTELRHNEPARLRQECVDAARALGFGHVRIILCHLVPNVLAPFLIMVTAFVGQAILAEASLSYLGLGVQEPVPAWGLMLQGGAEEYASTAPWIAIFPGVAIMLSVLGINLFGDALRDALDPKLRRR